MRNWIRSVAVVLALTPVCALAKDYSADRYDVQLQLTPQGTLHVTETVDFRFEGGPFTYVYRNIAATGTDGIRNVRAWMDGERLPAGRVQISGSSPVKVRWNFGPFSDSTHKFTVQYDALGVIRPEQDVQRLMWRALPGDRSYRIESSEITLEYPAGIATPEVSVERAGRIDAGPQRTVVHMQALRRNTQPVLTAVFRANSFTGPPPDWMTRDDRRREDFAKGVRASLAPAFLLLALGLFGAITSFRNDRPTLVVGSDPGSRMPPGPQPPAIAAALIGKPGGSHGILYELARRGVLRIEEAKSGFMGSRHFTIYRTNDAVALAPHERTFLDVAFKGGASAATLEELQSRLARKWSRIRQAIRAEIRAEGFVDESRTARRRWLFGSAAAGLMIGFTGLIFALVGLKSAGIAMIAGQALVYGATVLVLGIVLLIAASRSPKWSDTGMMMASRWRGYAHYLRDLSRGRVPAPGGEEFEQLLPYAAAFGVAHSLLRRQAKEGRAVLPPWFAALPSPDGDGAEIAALIAFTSSTDMGSGAGAGAGAGASGGGSSGAG